MKTVHINFQCDLTFRPFSAKTSVSKNVAILTSRCALARVQLPQQEKVNFITRDERPPNSPDLNIATELQERTAHNTSSAFDCATHESR